MYTDSELNKFKKFLKEIGIGFTANELLNNTTEIRIDDEFVNNPNNNTIVIVFDSMNEKFEKIDVY